MACFIEHTIHSYLESQKTLAARITAIDLLIDQAILLMADTIEGAGGNISSYELDDGQVRIKTAYRSMAEVEYGIKSLERMKQLYVNKLNGRSVQLRDSRTFR